MVFITTRVFSFRISKNVSRDNRQRFVTSQLYEQTKILCFVQHLVRWPYKVLYLSKAGNFHPPTRYVLSFRRPLYAPTWTRCEQLSKQRYVWRTFLLKWLNATTSQRLKSGTVFAKCGRACNPLAFQATLVWTTSLVDHTSGLALTSHFYLYQSNWLHFVSQEKYL